MSTPAGPRARQGVVALCDPTPNATNAAWRAALVARELGVGLRLLHVAPNLARAESSRQVLAGLAARIRERMGIDVEADAVGGDPLREAIKAAAEAALIVVGTGNPNRLRDWIAGTKVESLMRMCRTHLLLVNRSATSSYRRILVPVDFRADAAHALAMSAAVSRAPQVEALHVVSDRTESSAMAADMAEQGMTSRRRTLADSALRRLNDIVQDTEGAVVPRVAFGDAAEMIVTRAHAMRADVVVMGKTSASMIASFLMGSMTRRVLAHARTDVLLLHPPGEGIPVEGG